MLGQVTPAVVAPAFAVVRPKATVGLSGCAPATCACPVIEKVTKGCCCSKPEPAPEPKPVATACEAKPKKPKRKSCCSSEDAAPVETPNEAKSETKATEVVPTTAPVLSSAHKCSCDRSPTSSTVEPAISPDVELPTRWFATLDVPADRVPDRIPASFSHPPQPPPPKR
ncbi:MAG: hypothetical protein C0467_13180 [Planctomycetaceae bacterium]|nr:hypothetical protein [Planctomycetaceae bacterium]